MITYVPSFVTEGSGLTESMMKTTRKDNKY